MTETLNIKTRHAALWRRKWCWDKVSHQNSTRIFKVRLIVSNTLSLLWTLNIKGFNVTRKQSHYERLSQSEVTNTSVSLQDQRDLHSVTVIHTRFISRVKHTNKFRLTVSVIIKVRKYNCLPKQTSSTSFCIHLFYECFKIESLHIRLTSRHREGFHKLSFPSSYILFVWNVSLLTVDQYNTYTHTHTQSIGRWYPR